MPCLCHRMKKGDHASLSQEEIELLDQTWRAVQNRLSQSRRHHETIGWELVRSPTHLLDERLGSDHLSDYTSISDDSIARPTEHDVTGRWSQLSPDPRTSPPRPSISSLSTSPHPEGSLSRASANIHSATTSLQSDQSSVQSPREPLCHPCPESDRPVKIQSLVDLAQNVASVLRYKKDVWTGNPSAFTECETVSLRAALAETYTDAVTTLFQRLRDSEIHSKIFRMLLAYTVWKTCSAAGAPDNSKLKAMLNYGRAANKTTNRGSCLAMMILVPTTQWNKMSTDAISAKTKALRNHSEVRKYLEEYELLAQTLFNHLKKEILSYKQMMADSTMAPPIDATNSEDASLLLYTPSQRDNSHNITADHDNAASPQMTVEVAQTTRNVPDDAMSVHPDVPLHIDLQMMLAMPIQHGSQLLKTTPSSTCGESTSNIRTIEATFLYENGEGFHCHDPTEGGCNIDGSSTAPPPEHMLDVFDTDIERSHALIRSEASPRISYNETEEALEPNSMVMTGDVAPCRFDENISSGVFPPSGTTEGRIAAAESGEELFFSASQTTSAPTTLFFPGPGPDSGLGDRADSSRVFYPPSPFRTFLMPENIYDLIAVYLGDCCGKMVFDKNEILLSRDGGELRNDLCTDFDSYCFTATMFREKGMNAELCVALSKASALVGPILLAEHPRTLACFFEVLIHLLQTGLSEVALILRRFIKKMSAETSRKGGIWSRIFQLLDEIDLECLADVMTQGWKCTTDVFDRVLGSSHRLAVSVRLDYVKRIMIADYLKEERVLRDLLARMESRPVHSTPRVMLNLAHNLNRQGRHDEAEKVALEVSFMLQQYEIYAGRVAERIESLKVLSRSQFIQGRTSDAECYMRQAIRVIEDEWGERHPWALEFMNVLEGWLRCWDREEDANKLRGQIEKVIDN